MIGVRTIYPWVGTNDGAFWQIELGNLCFDTLIFERIFLDKQNFFIITVAVDVRAKTDIILNFTSREVYDSFMEPVLETLVSPIIRARTETYSVTDVVRCKCFAVDVWQTPPLTLGLEIWEEQCFWWLIECDRLKS